MVAALLGKKVGMTRIFDKEGQAIPVTVLQLGPCRVMQLKTAEKDGYKAAQLGFEEKKRNRATKPELGHAKKAGVEPARFVREVGLASDSDLTLGQVLTVGLFKEAKKVDVIGITKGRGFTGVVKRHGFSGMGDSHGVSKVHRAPGAVSSGTTMSRIWKGARMPGHMGHARKTVKNLRVARVIEDKHLLLVRGAVPGPNGGYVLVRLAAAEGGK
jgi:large subunit ribosomal protein L3